MRMDQLPSVVGAAPWGLRRQLRRVLRPGGLLYHYIGDPSSKASGKLFKGIHERLREAGFESTSTDKQAYGIVARVPPR